MQITDYEKISKEIREAAEKRGYPEEIPEFTAHGIFDIDILIDYNPEALQEDIKDINMYASISEYPEYFGKGLKAFMKRMVLKFVRFYVLPIVEKQNLFNSASMRSANQMNAYIIISEDRIHQLELQTAALKKEIQILKDQHIR